MYTEKIKTQDEAICHLFFHCCLKDGRFTETEIDTVSELLVRAGFHGKLNFKDEIIKYRSYDTTITDDAAYVRYLISLIKPANELALYSYCVELCFGDAELSLTEENLLNEIARALEISIEEQAVITKLTAERKVVETQKLF
jgi:uncharacterized tellurite resistance protein B-like protein